MALDTLVLRLKSLEIEDVLGFPYISRPSEEGLRQSIKLMTHLNCLNGKTEGITEIGRMLVKIPIEPFLSRAIIEGMMFEHCLKDKYFMELMKMEEIEKNKLIYMNIKGDIIKILCMVIHAANLFFIRESERERAEKKKYEKFSSEEGDFFFFLKIYNKYC